MLRSLMPLLPDDLAALRRAALGPALLALALAFAGTLLALMRVRWPAIPAWLVLVPIAGALGLIGLGLLRRVRHLLAAARRG